MRTRPEPASTLPAPATPDRRSTPVREHAQLLSDGEAASPSEQDESTAAEQTHARSRPNDPLTDHTVNLLQRPRPPAQIAHRGSCQAESSSQAPAATARGCSVAFASRRKQSRPGIAVGLLRLGDCERRIRLHHWRRLSPPCLCTRGASTGRQALPILLNAKASSSSGSSVEFLDRPIRSYRDRKIFLICTPHA